MATILQRLKKVISEQLGVEDDPLEPSASFIEDLNIDPEDLAEFITAVEAEFSTRARKLEIADDYIDELVTIQDLIDCLKDYGIED
jgi:acyl carrier protein